MKSLFLLLGILLPNLGFAYLSPPQFIRLVPPDSNLENENQIEQLCPKSSKDFEVCRKDKLRPLTWTLNVYEKPELSSKKMGEIRITGTPGVGLQAQFVPSGKTPIDFPSDSKGTDWGYSCFFEFSVSDVKNDWIQLPRRPFPSPAWINLKNDWPKKGDLDLRPVPKPLESGTVYSVESLGKIVITKFSESEFKFRKENANDMSCGEKPGIIPPLELQESTKPSSVLFDKDGHLVAWPAYCRGC